MSRCLFCDGRCTASMAIRLTLLISNATPTVVQVLDLFCFIEAFSTRIIKTLQWPRGVQSITFRGKNCIAIKKDIENAIKEKYEEGQKIMKSITVRKFDLQWMMNHPM